MSFKRKTALGHYNATRGEWRNAYRKARVDLRNSPNY